MALTSRCLLAEMAPQRPHFTLAMTPLSLRGDLTPDFAVQSQMHQGQYQQVQQLIFQQQQAQFQAQQQQQMQQGGMNWVQGGAAGRGRGRLSSWQQGGDGNPGPGKSSLMPCGDFGAQSRASAVISEFRSILASMCLIDSCAPLAQVSFVF